MGHFLQGTFNTAEEWFSVPIRDFQLSSTLVFGPPVFDCLIIPRVLGECSLSGGSSSETPPSGPPLDFPVLVWVLRWWFGSSGGFQLFFN